MSLSSEAKEREKEKQFLTDAELIRRLGIPRARGYMILRELDTRRGTGFPPKSKLFCDRRYWPAVKAWLDRHAGGLGETK